MKQIISELICFLCLFAIGKEPASVNAYTPEAKAMTAKKKTVSKRNYSQRHLSKLMDRINAKLKQYEGTALLENIGRIGVGSNQIDVQMALNTAQWRNEFRKKILNSPAVFFHGVSVPQPDTTIGVRDTCGVTLCADYNVWSTGTDRITVTLYNNSTTDISFGDDYSITYEDSKGMWRRLPRPWAVTAMARGAGPGGTYTFTASLHPRIFNNRPGRYRYFHEVRIGTHGKVLLMAEFRLSDNEEEVKKATKQGTGKTVLDSEESPVYDTAEVMPEYPGGVEALQKYLKRHLPSDYKGKEGHVILSFIVGKYVFFISD